MESSRKKPSLLKVQIVVRNLLGQHSMNLSVSVNKKSILGIVSQAAYMKGILQ